MKNTKIIVVAGIIAAIYTVLALISNMFGLSMGLFQLRLSEILCILPAITPAAIPGLTIGCFITNILLGGVLIDVVFGTIATLFGAIGTYLLRKHKYIVVLPPIVSNGIIVPLILYYGYGIKKGLALMILIVIVEQMITGIISLLLKDTLSRVKM